MPANVSIGRNDIVANIETLHGGIRIGGNARDANAQRCVFIAEIDVPCSVDNTLAFVGGSIWVLRLKRLRAA